ncbi:GNAT family N-acetyltransferase [Weissella diestrammenae]|uniref:GNAT family N-acetyltransferase n=1 Tax=Weissella diestrammenae TaxID=1162633 RepID=A0A7G9T5M6_9LACO|nr:GNAT family N-acetyltransferase [Weissella diestrammenae]MCM0582227.1 GNAT family N-acetyltransferase [Weissella diestrammenae]QNN75401.1 GNAT family N-acetyltransferase [Weissella diestrammenae]
MEEYTLNVKRTNELSAEELISIFKQRVNIFVVEQKCPYQEVDDKDYIAVHVYLTDTNNNIVAYTRIITGEDPNIISFGRVLVVKKYRHLKLGRKIVQATLDYIKLNYPKKKIQIGAQNYLQNFYHSFGFKNISPVYLEDNIPHVDMILDV